MKVEEKYEEAKKMIKDAEAYQKLKSLDKNEEAKEFLKDKDAKYIKEIKDIKTMRKVKANLSKVENVLEVKEELITQINIIKEQIIEMDKLEKEIQKEEKDVKEKEDKWRELDKKIAKTKEPGEREKLISEQEKIKKEFADTTIEERKEIINEKMNTLNKKVSANSKEELARKSFELGRKVSMCNVAARGLLEGKNIGDIDLDKNIVGKKFDANEEIKRILKYSRENNKEKNEKIKEEKIEKLPEKISEKHMQGEKKETSLVDFYNFKEKHPILAKIPGLTKFVNFIKNKNINQQKNNIEEKEFYNSEAKSNKEEVAKGTTNKKTYIPREENEFKKFLKESAEKGMEEARKNTFAYKILQIKKEQARSQQNMKDELGIMQMRGKGSNIKPKKDSYSKRSGDER